MMNFITPITVLILILISTLHFYWAFGGEKGLNYALPTQDGKKLIHPCKGLILVVALIILGKSDETKTKKQSRTVNTKIKLIEL